MNVAYLCLGGNLGNCSETFNAAITMLEKQNIRVKASSSLFTSVAWGMDNAPDFYNRVIQIETELSAADLMALLLTIEKNLGRERNDARIYQSRVIDLDILFFNEDSIKTGGLEIPHPRLHLRRFVLEPLNEIAPALIHPIFKKTVSQLLEDCEDRSKVFAV